MNKLYENIKNRRNALGMTQQELAEKMGYTNRSSIAKIENGAVDLSQSKIIQFAKVLETIPSELMGEVEYTDVRTDGHTPEYYDDATVQRVTEAMRNNPDSRIVFDAVSTMTPEDLTIIAKLVEKMSD
jgi:transcriptional regulator with XRE-family HTH domain